MTNFIKSIIFNNQGIISVVEKNQYIIHVDSKFKKPEIKKFCQEIFNTPVIYVNTLNLPPKKRHLKMKRAFVRFIGTKDTTNPIKNCMEMTSFSPLPPTIKEEIVKMEQSNSLSVDNNVPFYLERWK